MKFFRDETFLKRWVGFIALSLGTALGQLIAYAGWIQ